MDDTEIHLKYAVTGYQLRGLKHHWIWALLVPSIIVLFGIWILLTPDQTPDTYTDILLPRLGSICILLGFILGFSYWLTWLLEINSLFSLGANAIREGRIEMFLSILQSLYYCGAHGKARALQEIAFVKNQSPVGAGPFKK